MAKPNVQFNYLFRDEDNYKVFGAVIFSNPDKISLEVIDMAIRKNLISGQFFEAEKWKLPDLFISHAGKVDHGWCEYEGVEWVDDDPNDTRTINNFIKS